MPASAAQAGEPLFFEDFEDMGFVPIGGWGPQGLLDEGWIFANNSEPVGSQAWFGGCCWEGVISPLSGSGYLASSQDSAAGGDPQYSAWAVVPAIAGQQAGDILTFFSISSDTSPFESVHLEVRYSPSGDTETGKSATDFGDFSDLLLLISPMPNYNEGLYDGWTKWEIVLPGPGRIAFRQMGPDSMYFGLEDVSVAPPKVDTGPMPENFEDLDGICGEGPCRLINEEGWTFIDQGALTIGPAWQPPFAGDEFTAHSGVSFIKSLKGGGSGSVNTWAILPPIGNVAGDELMFVVRGGLGADAVFEVRYSPSGGISTGSGTDGTGDFTDVLLFFGEGQLPYDAWQQVAAKIPGSGRLALRMFDPHQPQFDPANLVAVDTMDINGVPSGPPLPAPGETVTWTTAISPIQINTDLFIPAGGTVIVEPGVLISIAAEATLSVGGTLEGTGTETEPIVIVSVANFPPGILVSGTLDLAFATINTQVRPDLNGSLLFNDCIFTGPNGIIFNQMGVGITLDDVPPFVLIDDCTFDDADVRPTDATIRITDSTFIDADAAPLRGYVFVDNLDITGGGLSISRDQQNVYINDIAVQNSPGPAIRVDGSNIGNDYLFGPDNVLTGNQYPAAASAGILPGSVLPPSGNSINAVLVQPVGFEIFGPVTWADPGIEYHVDQSPFLVGGFDVLPGVTMKFQPGHGFAETSGFESRGLPENPVTFEALGGGQWYAIFTPLRLEYTIVDGSEFGIVNPVIGLPGFYDTCVFSNNARAQVGSAIVRKSQFLNNTVGAHVGFTMDLDGQTNPNWFEGNALAVEEASDATHNWWGHPTGPNGPQNPGGQGDPVAGGVPVLPFLTAPPDLENHPPVVNMQEIYFVAEPGSTVILNWETTDADLVSQRVLLSTQSDVPDQYTVVAELPATQRSYALNVPAQDLVFGLWYVRVEGIDSLGQIGWDRKYASTRQVSIDPTIVPPPVPPAESFVLGYPIPLGEDVTHFFTGWVLLDGQMLAESFGAAGVLPTRVDASSDTVRIGLIDGANWFFSEYLTVRPDERLGDEAPTVTLNSPTGGSLAGGSVVNISWTASDDEGIRYVSLQGSYDGGLTFHDIARRLPGDQTSFNWQLPPLDEPIASAMVRVIVEDLRFQNSSDTSGEISLVPDGDKIIGDLNGDSVVGPPDLAELLAQWGACADCNNCPADFSGDCNVGPADLAALLANWS